MILNGYGEIAFYFTDGNGPVTIRECSIENIRKYIIYVNNTIGLLSFLNNYIEINNPNIYENMCVVYGNIETFVAMCNNMEINSVFRCWNIKTKNFISIGNHYTFDKDNTNINEIITLMNGHYETELFVALDTFHNTSIKTTEYSLYNDDRNSLYLTENSLVIGRDPVTKKRYYNLYSAYDSSKRPNNVIPGYMYFDTTLNKPIWWSGEIWIDSSGEPV